MKIHQSGPRIAWVFLLLTSFGFGQTTFSLTVLPDLGYGAFLPRAINIHGHVVGEVKDSANYPQAALWNGSSLTQLGTFGGPVSWASDINDDGVIVGFADAGGGSGEHAYVYQNGVMTNLNWSVPGFTSQAKGINSAGVIVGYAVRSGGGRVIIDDGATRTELSLGSPVAINASGEIAGSYESGVGYRSGFFYDGAQSNIGSFHNFYTLAHALNDHGVVVGQDYTPSSVSNAVVYENGVLSELGGLGGTDSVAWGINNLGDIVGSADNAAEAPAGFLYSSGMMYDLNTLLVGADGWNVFYASAINDAGQIVGQATFDGTTYGVLLSPLSAIPEPSTYALVAGVGAVGLALRRRRQVT